MTKQDAILSKLTGGELVTLAKGQRNAATSKAQSAIAEAARRYGVSEADVMASGKRKGATQARQWVYTRLWHSGMSLPQVARVMGRDHTTVLHGIKKTVGEMMDKEIFGS